MEMLLRIMHHETVFDPSTLQDAASYTAFIVLCDKYRCKKLCDWYLKPWLSDLESLLEHKIVPHTLDIEDCGFALLAPYMLRSRYLPRLAAKVAQGMVPED